MKRSFYFALPAVALGLMLLPDREPVRAATKSSKAASPSPSADAPIPPTRFYPLSIGNRWEYGFRRITAFSMVPATGQSQDFNINTTGTQTVEITREDGERSGDRGKVFVQRATEKVASISGAPDEENEGEAPPNPNETRLVGDLYFRLNDRGIWLIADGEANEKGDEIEKVEDRRLPLLWVPADLKPDKSWIINCQIDTDITARITARAGKPRSLRVNGVTYENCIPVVSIADRLEGRLNMGIALAPIKEGRLVDITWYAPAIGVVRSHQLANFELEPPNANYTSATAHFEETQELQPGHRVQ